MMVLMYSFQCSLFSKACCIATRGLGPCEVVGGGTWNKIDVHDHIHGVVDFGRGLGLCVVVGGGTWLEARLMCMITFMVWLILALLVVVHF